MPAASTRPVTAIPAYAGIHGVGPRGCVELVRLKPMPTSRMDWSHRGGYRRTPVWHEV